MATNYPLTPGTLASNCYPANPQALYNEMFAQGFVQLTISGVVVSATTPDPSDRDKLWVQIDGSSNPVRQWIYANGLWRWPHEVPASASERRLWVGSEASLATYDGGSSGTATTTSGPFWEVDHDFDARMLVGPGTLADSGTTINVGDTGGNDEITPTVAQLPEHHHNLFNDAVGGSSNLASSTQSAVRVVDDSGNSNYEFQTNGSEADNPATVGQSGDTGNGDPINNMPPYVGIFIIKRTIRVYRTP